VKQPLYKGFCIDPSVEENREINEQNSCVCFVCKTRLLFRFHNRAEGELKVVQNRCKNFISPQRPRCGRGGVGALEVGGTRPPRLARREPTRGGLSKFMFPLHSWAKV
jgi:hypothetical protein